MKTVERYFALLFVGVLISSCLTVQTVPIDQMEPGKVNLPEQIRKIALLSRNFKFDIDTLGQYYNANFKLKKGPLRENKYIDTIAVTKSFESLRKILLESGRFDEIAVYPYATVPLHKGKNVLPLSSDFVKKLCDESGTDAVVSLEMLSYFYGINAANPRFGVPKSSEVKITAIWAVYYPRKEGPINRFKYSDVIRWDENRQANDDKGASVPPRTEGIKLACEIAAKNYSKQLAPYWSKSERVLVGLDNDTWRKAITLAQKYKWEDAATLWQSYTNANNQRVRGASALDLAVAKEMLGDYDQAERWSKESLKLLKGGKLRQIAVDYANFLKTRKIKVEKLNHLIK
jgi:hypothetical protein